MISGDAPFISSCVIVDVCGEPCCPHICQPSSICCIIGQMSCAELPLSGLALYWILLLVTAASL